MELKGTRLAGILNSEIDAQTDDDTSRGDVMARMARAGGIAVGTLQEILSGEINCPPLRRLEGFAEVLNISMSRLRAAAEEDGCEYSEAGKALFCRLTPSMKSVMNQIEEISRKL